MWISQRWSSVVIPSSSGSGQPEAMRPTGQLGQDGLEESAQFGDVVHRDRAFHDVLIDQPARGAQERLDSGIVGGRMHGDLGIGTLERLGTDASQQGPERGGWAGSAAISRIL